MAVDIQFIQPFMESGCNWKKREKRELYPINSIDDITQYASRIILAARDIDESYIEAARRKAEGT
jgi:hypothetical protein